MSIGSQNYNYYIPILPELGNVAEYIHWIDIKLTFSTRNY